MAFIEKVASYYGTYLSSDNTEGLLKTASEEGVSKDDLIAYHNLTEGNIFTGDNIIQIEGDPENSDSKLIQLGLTIDKVASEGLDENLILEKAAELQMDSTDVGFIVANIQKQAAEAGVVEPDQDPELVEKVASSMKYLLNNGIDPIQAYEMYLNVDEEGNFTDEKVASLAQQYTEEDFDKIAEAIEMIGREFDDEVASIVLDLAQ